MSIFVNNKKLFRLSIFAFLFFCFFASQNKAEAGTVVVNGIYDSSEYTTATIGGYCTPPADGIYPDGFVYAVYSTNPTFAVADGTPTSQKPCVAVGTMNTFTIPVSGLVPGTTYYYKVLDFGTEYGEGSFTTLDTDTYIGDVITVTPESTTSLITGTYSKGEFTEIGLGSDTNFIYASYTTDETFASGVTFSPVASFSTMDGYDPDFFGKFTINLFGLSPDTTYYFKLLDNAKTYYGYPENTSAKFTTASAPEETTATVGGTTTESTASCDGEFGYCLLAPLPGLEKITPDINFGDYVNTIFGLIIGLSGAVAVVIIVIAGITYMSSDVITKKSTALNMIWNTLGGIALLLCAYILLNTINPNLVNFKLSINSVNYEVSGDLPGTLSPLGSYLPAGIYCPGSGGFSEIGAVASSFVNNVIYKMGGKGSESSPDGKIYLDCSGYQNKVRQCVGLSNLGATANMFPGTENVSSLTGTSANGTEMNTGDLLGWSAGECPNSSFGHVVMYLGDGKIIDVHGPEGAKNNAYVRDLESYTFKSCVKHIIRSV